jgi:hypothetical protein
MSVELRGRVLGFRVLIRSTQVVCYLEYFIHVLSGRIVVNRWLSKPAHHVINGRHDVHHFVSRYVPIVIDIVQTERPFEFLLDRATSEHRQTHDKVLQTMRHC